MGKLIFWFAFGWAVASLAHCQTTPDTFIHVTEFSKRGAHQDTIKITLAFIVGNADAQCKATLPGLIEGVLALTGGPLGNDDEAVLIGHGAFTPRNISAFTGNDTKRTDAPAGTIVFVNDNGGFFVSTFTTDEVNQRHKIFKYQFHGYDGGTNQAKVIILLHELAHFLNVAQPDFANQGAVDANDALVANGCKSVLKAAGKAQQF